MERDRGEQRLAAAHAAAMPAAWDLDAATGVLLTSEAFRRLHGWRADRPMAFEGLTASIVEEDAAWARALARKEFELLPQSVSYRIRSGDAIRWIRTTIEIARDATTGEWLGATGIAQDITEIAQATQLLRESDERLRLAIEAGRMAVWEVELATGQLTQSPELNVLLGLPPEARPTLWDVRELYAPGEIERLERDGVTLEAVRNRSAQGGYSSRTEAQSERGDRTQMQAEFSLITPAGTHKRLLLRAQYAPRPRDHAMVTGVLVDVTEQARARDRLAIVARELRHRVKNTIAVVKALAAQTFRSHEDPREGLDSFAGRLQALALATDAILDEDLERTDLLVLTSKILSPYVKSDAPNIRIEGEPIPLTAKQASALGMVLHEFGTNAIKYGALSVAEGRVALTWSKRIDADRVDITWEEIGGPIVSAPSRQGFGSRLVAALVAGDLKGSLNTQFERTGFRADMSIPVGDAFER